MSRWQGIGEEFAAFGRFCIAPIGRAIWRGVEFACTLFDWDDPVQVGRLDIWKRPWACKDECGFGENWTEGIIGNLVGGMYEMLDGVIAFSSAGFIQSSFHYDFVLRRAMDGFKRKERAEARKKQQVIVPCLRGRVT